MQGASAPATVTEGRQAPADWDLSLPSAVKGFLSSSVSRVCHKPHRNQYEVARVSRVTPCPLAMIATIHLLLKSKPRGLVAAGDMRAGTKEESSPFAGAQQDSQDPGSPRRQQTGYSPKWHLCGVGRRSLEVQVGSRGLLRGLRGLGRGTPAQAECCSTK